MEFILAAESNKFKLILRESLLIKRDKPILNRTIKSFPLELLTKMTVLFLLFCYHMVARVFLYIVVILMCVPTELGYVLICQVKGKKCNFENAFVEKSESSTRNKKWISRRIVIIFSL